MGVCRFGPNLGRARSSPSRCLGSPGRSTEAPDRHLRSNTTLAPAGQVTFHKVTQLVVRQAVGPLDALQEAAHPHSAQLAAFRVVLAHGAGDGQADDLRKKPGSFGALRSYFVCHLIVPYAVLWNLPSGV